jgi:uncharacterized protein (TIGR02646 family)
MRKIEKDLSTQAVPESLRLPEPAHFAEGNVPSSAKTTHERRLEAIHRGTYQNDEANNKWYRGPDIKTALKAIYHHKCAYCEQKVEQFQVEHYRPKATYCWLAFSWDNLLSVCQYCNQYKGTRFPIKGSKVALPTDFSAVQDIHAIGASYDAIELPDLLNPETTDPQGKLKFEKNGSVSSSDARTDVTIGICRLSRTYLNDARKKILEELRNDFFAELTETKTKAEQLAAIGVIVRKFKREALDVRQEFTAFRRYILQN